MMISLDNLTQLAWQKMSGLLPAIVQHESTGTILMQAYMDQAALTATLTSGQATFYSRSKQALWLKGATSGNYLQVTQIITDCDGDSLLLICRPLGPACHLGTESCFVEQPFSQQNFLSELETIIAQRASADTDSSYTAQLLAKDTSKIAQKVGEEGVEVALAAVAEGKTELLGECADLLYHLLVLLQHKQINLSEVMAVLQQRHLSARN
jgi:phosphoribosyl-AMP cyclohydrolase / phosphoribosyl-ATP pyrophosphohydrolase